MPAAITVTSTDPGFAGVRTIFQFTNSDGQEPRTVCGQAACATLLTYVGTMPADIETLRQIETSHPPNLFWGHLGTSPGQIKAALRAYGAWSLREVNSVDELKHWVRALCPVICLIQNKGGLAGLVGSGAHWFVVFAYNEAGVFVTNYAGPAQAGYLSWADFQDRWESYLSAAFKGVTNTGCIRDDTAPSRVIRLIRPRLRKMAVVAGASPKRWILPMSLSVCLLTRNQETDLPVALRSVAGLAEEVIVADAASTDATGRVAADLGAQGGPVSRGTTTSPPGATLPLGRPRAIGSSGSTPTRNCCPTARPTSAPA